ALILDVFELLWKSKLDLKLCIAGKKGWLVDELMTRIQTHPEFGNRLIFIENPNDSEIEELYKFTTGLIFLSRGEGFGLPLIEAAHYGVPIICSNIPVFREIAGAYATYVNLDSPQSISYEVIKWYALKNKGELPDSRAMPKLNWEESSKCLLNAIFEENWYWNNGKYWNEKDLY
ncbi:MAG: glycosyltransferase, partial [Nitrosomonas sp.]|nr:glycosyltransferase [Nitrosomonas sp.]